jgi:glycosyltransferase involved in cell wall biosynthesis
MKILLATMSMGIGGAETHILELAKELKKRGNEIWVVSNGGKYNEELEAFGVHTVWAPLHNKKPQNMIKSYKILKELITNEGIELVHSHTRISSFILGLLHKKMNFPFATSAHWTFKVTPLFKFMTNWGEGTIAVSDDIKEYLIKNYGIPEEQIVVTVNGIDTEKFSKNIDYKEQENEFSLKADCNRIVYISRLDESRALVAKQLVNIAEELDSSIENLEIVIVGGGDSFDEIKQKADNINAKLGKRLIVLTGPRTDINKFAVMGRIFIGVSRAALEAMAAEKPVIVAGNEGYIGIFDESKLEKAIETNFCCRGLEMSSEDTLKRDVLELIKKDDEFLENQGFYNRSIVSKYYSVEKMTNDCEIVYKNVLKLHKKA